MPKKVLTYADFRKKLKLKELSTETDSHTLIRKPRPHASTKEAAELLASLPVPANSDYQRPVPITVSAVSDLEPMKRPKHEEPKASSQGQQFKEVSQQDLLDEEWQDKYRQQQDIERIKTLERSKLSVSERQRKMNHLVALAEEVIDNQEEYDDRFQQSLTARKQGSMRNMSLRPLR